MLKRSLYWCLPLAAACLWLSSCDHDALFGSGPGADAAVSTPTGVQTGLVALDYTLTSDSVTASDIDVAYSTDGTTFRDATEGTGSDGTRNLSASAAGEGHTFVWDSNADLGGERASNVIVRIRPESGLADATGTFTVSNGRFLLAVENEEQGRVRLYEINAVDGDSFFLGASPTGGTDPYETLYFDGHFFVAHRTSNDVAVFDLDSDGASITAVDGSPVRTDGIQATYLAAYGEYVFVANTGDETITVFDFDSESGALALSPHSGVNAPDCQAILARSARLYVASQAHAEVLVFDITDDGELLNNANSPITTGGLTSPRSLVSVGSRVYVGNFAEATIAGFNLQGNGNLSALAGSPFAASSAGIEDLATVEDKVIAATGVGASVLSLTVDVFGDLTEDAGSPLPVSGPVFGVAGGGRVIVGVTTTSENVHVFSVDSIGDVSEIGDSPVDGGVELLRAVISD